jgi:hypothetical protein
MMMALFLSMALRAPARSAASQAAFDFLRDLRGQRATWSAESRWRPHRARPAPACPRRGKRIAFGRDDHDLGGAGDEVDARLRPRAASSPRLHRCCRARRCGRRFGTVWFRRRAPRWPARRPSETPGDAQQVRVPRISSLGFGQATQMFVHARHLRRNHRHDQRGGQRIAARRNVRAHGIERPHDLPQPRPGRIFEVFARQLLLGVARMLADATSTAREIRASAMRSPPVRWRARGRFAVEAVELARVFEQRLVAALAHGFEDRRTTMLRFVHAASARRTALRDSRMRIRIARHEPPDAGRSPSNWRMRIITSRSCSADIRRCLRRPPA